MCTGLLHQYSIRLVQHVRQHCEVISFTRLCMINERQVASTWSTDGTVPSQLATDSQMHMVPPSWNLVQFCLKRFQTGMKWLAPQYRNRHVRFLLCYAKMPQLSTKTSTQTNPWQPGDHQHWETYCFVPHQYSPQGGAVYHIFVISKSKSWSCKKYVDSVTTVPALLSYNSAQSLIAAGYFFYLGGTWLHLLQISLLVNTPYSHCSDNVAVPIH